MNGKLKTILLFWTAIVTYGLISDQALKGRFGAVAQSSARNVANGYGV